MDSELVAWLLALGCITLAAGAGFSFVPGRRGGVGLALSHWVAALGSGALAVEAVGAIRMGGTLELGALPLLPTLGDLRFRVDPLSAFFVLLIGGLGVAASLYAVGYTARPKEAAAPAWQGAMWNLFLMSMVGVALAADGLSFLLTWELMSVVSFLLVVAEHQDPEVRQSGYFYVVMTHVGTAFLVGAFLLLFARTGSLDFATFRAAANALPPGLRDAVFVLTLVGFGTKAGLVPLHVWLPRAHPAAPSHVSALMSGAMVKTAIYGMLRFTFDILGGGPTWWGGALMAIGGLSALVGVLYATQQSHLKRLLAYSTVENIGLLFLGIGAALVAKSNGLTAIAALALSAVLFHAMSHAAFKGLAFMGAGSVLHGTGTVDMERLGGLIRPMPRTAALFLVGTMGVAGLPLFSGFIGEWLSLQTFLHLARAGAGVVAKMGALLAIGAIALAAGLAAAAAVKAFGITFLARPRTGDAEHAHDAQGTMLAGMALTALAVVGLGLFPGTVLRLAAPVAGVLLPGVGAEAFVPGAGGALAALTATSGGAAVSVAAVLAPLAAPLTVVVLSGLALLVALILGRGRPRWREGITWTCGIEPFARMEYSGAGFTKPILLMFRGLLHPVRTLAVEPSPHPLFPGRVHYQSELKAVIELRLYRPVTETVMNVASWLRRFQTGSLQTYLLYLLLAAVAVIVAAR